VLGVTVGSSTVGATVGQIVAIVIGAFVVWVAGYVFAKNRTMYGDVREMKRALITEPATPLNPNPTPGLIDVVSTHSQMLNTLLTGTKALIADSQANDGHTSRDALDRIEAEQARVASKLPNVD